MPDEPICIARWFHANANNERSGQRILDRAWPDLPAELRPDVAIVNATEKAGFANGIRDWRADNANAQYLAIATHGIIPEGETHAIGIGSIAENRAIEEHEFMTWDELIGLINEEPDPPHLLWIGCRTADVIPSLNATLRPGQEAPALVALTEVVQPKEMLATFRLLSRLLDSTRRTTSIADDAPIFSAEFPNTAIYYPVTHLPDLAPQYVDLARFEEITGMTFEAYTNLVNQVVCARLQREDDERQLRGN